MTDTAQRSHRIAALHAYADYLADHPEIPAPNELSAYYHTSIAEVKAFAAAQREDFLSAGEGNTTRWVTLYLSIGEMGIRHTVLGSL